MSAITSSGSRRQLPAVAAPGSAFAAPLGLTLADERDAAIQALVSCGWSHRRIGRLFGLHGATVARTLQRLLTLPSQKHQPDPLTAAEVEQLLKEYATEPDLTADERAEALDWLERLRPADPPPA